MISPYAPTDCNTEVKDEFYKKLSSLLRKAKRSDVVTVLRGFSAQVDKLNQNERPLGGYLMVLRLSQHIIVTVCFNYPQITIYFWQIPTLKTQGEAQFDMVTTVDT